MLPRKMSKDKTREKSQQQNSPNQENLEGSDFKEEDPGNDSNENVKWSNVYGEFAVSGSGVMHDLKESSVN